jgi:tRNA threonylcarbamoyladenosine biosynthesis protein TsaB
LKLLAIDTSTEACSAALAIEHTILTRFELAPRRHTELLLPMVDQLLGEAALSVHELEGLAFGRGPGSFTGVRIATGVIQGIALGTDLLVAPISSLAALAQGVFSKTGQPQVLAAIDARINEVYWGAYQADEQGIMRASQPECLCSPTAAPLPAHGRWFGGGTGWGIYADLLGPRLGDRLLGVAPDCYPHAREVAILGLDAFNCGSVVEAGQALPVYLREKVVD